MKKRLFQKNNFKRLSKQFAQSEWRRWWMYMIDIHNFQRQSKIEEDVTENFLNNFSSTYNRSASDRLDHRHGIWLRYKPVELFAYEQSLNVNNHIIIIITITGVHRLYWLTIQPKMIGLSFMNEPLKIKNVVKKLFKSESFKV